MAYAPSCMHLCLRALSILILASILVAGLADEPPSHYRAELIHVEANGGFCRDELISRAAHRTHLRAATYSVTAHYDKHDHQYLMDLEIGKPPKHVTAVLDTGSNIVLLTNPSLCSPTSSSFTYEECSGPQSVEPTHSTMCPSCYGGLRMFQNKYGDKKTVLGFMGKETLAFTSPETPFPGVNVSCAIYARCDDVKDCPEFPKSAAGIVGLGRGPQSLLKQLRDDQNKPISKFSYCLNDPLKPHLKSQLWLGNVHLPNTGGVVHTAKLVERGSNKYNVHLHSISIGDPECNKAEKCFPVEQSMLVDTGSPYISLPADAFHKVEEAVSQLFKPESRITPTEEKPFYFYRADGLKGTKPEMNLSFGKDEKAIMRLPWNRYMVEVKCQPLFFLAVQKNTQDKYILGNFQQQNMAMLYDLDKETLSFVETDCSCIPENMHTSM